MATWKFLAPAFLLLTLAGCQTESVGAPCLPEGSPDDGYRSSEVYLESSVQCESRTCMVYRLDGDPSGACVESDDKRCASDNEVNDRIYCTCRCGGGDEGAPGCECPDGYACQEVLDKGDPGLRGSYCVKGSTVGSYSETGGSLSE